jgi:hypothetical protein
MLVGSPAEPIPNDGLSVKRRMTPDAPGARRRCTVAAVLTIRCWGASSPYPGPHDQFPVVHAVARELGGERGLHVRELRGEVLALARPQLDLAAAADRSDAAR